MQNTGSIRDPQSAAAVDAERRRMNFLLLHTLTETHRASGCESEIAALAKAMHDADALPRQLSWTGNHSTHTYESLLSALRESVDNPDAFLRRMQRRTQNKACALANELLAPLDDRPCVQPFAMPYARVQNPQPVSTAGGSVSRNAPSALPSRKKQGSALVKAPFGEVSMTSLRRRRTRRPQGFLSALQVNESIALADDCGPGFPLLRLHPDVLHSSFRLAKRIRGHHDPTYCCRFDRTSQRFVTGSDDGLLKVWNAQTAFVERTLRGHSAEIVDIAFVPGRDVLISAASDSSVRLWDLVTGEAMMVLDNRWTRDVHAIAMSPRPESPFLVTAGAKGTVRLWHLGALSAGPVVVHVPPAPMNNHVHNPAGAAAARARAARGLALPRSFSATGEAVNQLVHDQHPVDELLEADVHARTRTASSIAPAPSSSPPLRSVPGPSGISSPRLGTSPASSPQVGGAPADAALLQSPAPSAMPSVAGSMHTAHEHLPAHSTGVAASSAASGSPSAEIFAVKFNAGGNRFVISGDDCAAHVYALDKASAGGDNSGNLPNVRLLTSLRGHTNYIYLVCFARHSDAILTGSRDGTARIWRRTSAPYPQRRVRGEAVPGVGTWTSVVLDTRVAGGARAIDASTGHFPSDIPNGAGRHARRPPFPGSVDSIMWSLDDKLIVTGSSDAVLRVWDSATGKLRHTLEGHTDCVYVLSPHPWDKRIVVSGSYDGSCIMWDIENGRQVKHLLSREVLRPLLLNQRNLQDDAPPPRGDLGGEAGPAQAEPPQPPLALPRMPCVLDGEFSPDGASFVTADMSGSIALISVDSDDFWLQAPNEQFLQNDYVPFVRDNYGRALEEGTDRLWHVKERALLCNSDLLPHSMDRQHFSLSFRPKQDAEQLRIRNLLQSSRLDVVLPQLARMIRPPGDIPTLSKSDMSFPDSASRQDFRLGAFQSAVPRLVLSALARRYRSNQDDEERRLLREARARAQRAKEARIARELTADLVAARERVANGFVVEDSGDSDEHVRARQPRRSGRRTRRTVDYSDDYSNGSGSFDDGNERRRPDAPYEGASASSSERSSDYSSGSSSRFDVGRIRGRRGVREIARMKRRRSFPRRLSVRRVRESSDSNDSVAPHFDEKDVRQMSVGRQTQSPNASSFHMGGVHLSQAQSFESGRSRQVPFPAAGEEISKATGFLRQSDGDGDTSRAQVGADLHASVNSVDGRSHAMLPATHQTLSLHDVKNGSFTSERQGHQTIAVHGTASGNFAESHGDTASFVRPASMPPHDIGRPRFTGVADGIATRGVATSDAHAEAGPSAGPSKVQPHRKASSSQLSRSPSGQVRSDAHTDGTELQANQQNDALREREERGRQRRSSATSAREEEQRRGAGSHRGRSQSRSCRSRSRSRSRSRLTRYADLGEAAEDADVRMSGYGVDHNSESDHERMDAPVEEHKHESERQSRRRVSLGHGDRSGPRKRSRSNSWSSDDDLSSREKLRRKLYRMERSRRGVHTSAGEEDSHQQMDVAALALPRELMALASQKAQARIQGLRLPGPFPLSASAWLRATSNMHAYIPQVQDEVVYFAAGHRKAIEYSRNAGVQPILLPSDPEMARQPMLTGMSKAGADASATYVIVGIEYQFPARLTSLPRGAGSSLPRASPRAKGRALAVDSLRVAAVLRLRPVEPMKGAMSPSQEGCDDVSLTYYPVDDVPEYVVLSHRVKTAADQVWTAGARFRIVFLNERRTWQYYTGRVRRVKSRVRTAPWNAIEVEYDNEGDPEMGNVDHVSPWELEPIAEGDRAPDGLVPLAPKPRATPTDVAVFQTIGRKIEALQALDLEFKRKVTWFVDPVESLARVKGYCDTVPCPLDLGIVLTRLRSSYYRCYSSFVHDMSFIRTNAILFNSVKSEIADAANFVYGQIMDVAEQTRTLFNSQQNSLSATNSMHGLGGATSARIGNAAAMTAATPSHPPVYHTSRPRTRMSPSVGLQQVAGLRNTVATGRITNVSSPVARQSVRGGPSSSRNDALGSMSRPSAMGLPRLPPGAAATHGTMWPPAQTRDMEPTGQSQLSNLALPPVMHVVGGRGSQPYGEQGPVHGDASQQRVEVGEPSRGEARLSPTPLVSSSRMPAAGTAEAHGHASSADVPANQMYTTLASSMFGKDASQSLAPAHARHGSLERVTAEATRRHDRAQDSTFAVGGVEYGGSGLQSGLALRPSVATSQAQNGRSLTVERSRVADPRVAGSPTASAVYTHRAVHEIGDGGSSPGAGAQAWESSGAVSPKTSPFPVQQRVPSQSFSTQDKPQSQAAQTRPSTRGASASSPFNGANLGPTTTTATATATQSMDGGTQSCAGSTEAAGGIAAHASTSESRLLTRTARPESASMMIVTEQGDARGIIRESNSTPAASGTISTVPQTVTPPREHSSISVAAAESTTSHLRGNANVADSHDFRTE